MQQVGKYIGYPLQIDMRSHIKHRIGTHHTNDDLDHRQQSKTKRQDREQVVVCADNCKVDHPLHEEGRDQCKHFQCGGQQKDLAQ